MNQDFETLLSEAINADPNHNKVHNQLYGLIYPKRDWLRKKKHSPLIELELAIVNGKIKAMEDFLSDTRRNIGTGLKHKYKQF